MLFPKYNSMKTRVKVCMLEKSVEKEGRWWWRIAHSTSSIQKKRVEKKEKSFVLYPENPLRILSASFLNLS